MIISDIADGVKLVRTVILATVGGILGVFSVASIIAFVVVFFATSLSCFSAITNIVDYLVVRFSPDLNSDLYYLVSYCFNFAFIQDILKFVYTTTVVLASCWVGFQATIIILSAVPWIVNQFRSLVNLFTGDM